MNFISVIKIIIMSKFINNCVSYSESNVLKIKLLKPLLTNFNEHLVNINKNSFKNSINTQEYIIPNNNIKYYLFITNKSNVNSQSRNYQLLYFFPEVTTNENSDFYMEIDNLFPKDNILLEGYIYNKSTFLATDILFTDSKLVDANYNTRQSLLKNLIKGFNYVNGHFNIGIHHTLTNENYTCIFMENFIYKKELKSIEYVNENNFYKTKKHFNVIKQSSPKIIEKTKYIEVYKVYNVDTKNEEGILYIPKLVDAQKITKILNGNTSTIINCKWNERFYKWTPEF
jgi:hypothetical protein